MQATATLGSDARESSNDPAAERARPSACPIHTLFRGSGAGVPLTRRLAILTTGLVAYLMFVGAFTYAIGFVANLVVPKSIDSGTPGPLVPSLIVNGLLLSLFAVQHTIMARPRFKRWLARFVPEAMERSLFVAAASGSLMLLFWQWRPLPDTIWHIDQPILRCLLIGVSLSGYAIVFAASWMINHLDLFGLRQTWHGVAGTTRPGINFVLTGFYRFVRHPLMTGFLIAFWVTPTMTVGHLFFAAMTTAYILFGTWIEERDLIANLGDTYRNYRKQVPAFFPIPR